MNPPSDDEGKLGARNVPAITGMKFDRQPIGSHVQTEGRSSRAIEGISPP
jgi:hypothetical protein